MSSVTIFTDGSCYYKTGEGGIGVFMEFDDGKRHLISKGFRNTKTGRMELLAVINALMVLGRDKLYDVFVFSDSEYVVKSFTENRIDVWLNKDFDGVANSDLWVELLDLVFGDNINSFNIKHVKGHCKIVDKKTYGNNVADLLADYKMFSHRETDMSDEEWEIYINKKQYLL